MGNKNLENIWQIVTFTKVENIAKPTVEITTDLIMMAKRRGDSRPNKDCFNCKKKGHYVKDCHSFVSNKKKSEELIEKSKCT